MKLTHWLYQVVHTKIGYMLLLFAIWGAIGFVFGLLLGRVLTLFNFV